MKELMIYEGHCSKVVSEETKLEVRENIYIRKIAIELYSKKDEANKSFIKALAQQVYPKLKNLSSAELTLWDCYLPETLININESLTTLSLQIEGSNFDFLELLKRYKQLTTLKIFMEVKPFCQTNILEVVTPVTSLESLTLDFTNQPRS
jgi:hypothetical protein